jgi:hypothetical protein
MVLCREKKCIFIHIPKTGGTSIEQFIKDHDRNILLLLGVKNNRSLQHLLASEVKLIAPYLYKKYYKFSIVRNPYDRLLSEYYWNPTINLAYKSGKSKKEFLNSITDIIKNNKYYDNIYNDHFIPQYYFLYNNNNKLLVNQIFKYEDLDWVSKYLKKKLNINRDFPYLNKNNIEKENWNDEEKEIIYNLYKNDFLYFGYNK